jgi:hypothetical protein
MHAACLNFCVPVLHIFELEKRNTADGLFSSGSQCIFFKWPVTINFVYNGALIDRRHLLPFQNLEEGKNEGKCLASSFHLCHCNHVLRNDCLLSYLYLLHSMFNTNVLERIHCSPTEFEY